MKVLLGLFAAVVVLLPGVASAYVISYTTSTPIGSTLTDWTGTLAFQKFNPSFGTLNSVTIGLSGSLSTVLTITNNSGESSSGTGKTEVQMTVQDAGSNLINTPQIDLFSPDYSYSLGAGGSTTSGTLTKNGTSSDLYTAAAVLSEFTGASGNTVLNASTFTQTWLTNTGGNTFASQVTNASLTGTVTYDYVPEPATMAMLGLGALGLAARRRRSR
jgi:hypothetical protein